MTTILFKFMIKNNVNNFIGHYVDDFIHNNYVIISHNNDCVNNGNYVAS